MTVNNDLALLVQQLRAQLADDAIDYVDLPDGHEDLPGVYASMRHTRRKLAEAEAAAVDDGRRFGRNNPHCVNCGDEHGGPFGHEISECRYRAGMTVVELADTMDPVRRSAYYETQVERYLTGALRERGCDEPDDLGPTVTETIDRQWDAGTGQHWPDCRIASCNGCMGPPTADVEEAGRG